MKDSEENKKIVQFENLNLLGKVVYVGGVLSRVTSGFIETAVSATSEIVSEAEKAFKEGLDPNVEDAKIIEEVEEKGKKGSV